MSIGVGGLVSEINRLRIIAPSSAGILYAIDAWINAQLSIVPSSATLFVCRFSLDYRLRVMSEVKLGGETSCCLKNLSGRGLHSRLHALNFLGCAA